MDVASEPAPLVFEQAQVGVHGGGRDAEFRGDPSEGIAVLPELVLAQHAPASSW